MGEILIVRHGQASYGTDDYDRLSPLGHQQAGWLGEWLARHEAGFDRIISGTLRRHRETAAGIGAHLDHGPIDKDPRLNEMQFFAMERQFRQRHGIDEDEASADPEGHFTRVMQAWKAQEISDAPESYADFRSRVLDALNDHALPDHRLLIVSSGGPVGIVLSQVLGLDLGAMTELILSTYNASITRLHLRRGGLRLTQFNAVPHLEHPDRRHALTWL
ncbi:MAG: histidine phosphatase family protein [Paracoccaceae bacterium]|nr:histidine phosphatase family protein [Paracoccaceae bacterium]